MIEVIYRENVSEDSICEPRNVKQIDSVDPKYRIYLEEAVLSCIRERKAAENEVYCGVLLGELKRAAGVTYLFIRGAVKAEAGLTKQADSGKAEAGARQANSGKAEETGAKQAESPKTEETGTGAKKGSGAVALRRLTLDRQRRDRNWESSGESRIGEKDRKEQRQPEENEREVRSGYAGEVNSPIVFDGDTWTALYEDINRYFPDMEILGWYASFPFLNVAGFDLCRQIHYTHFSGADKVLFLCDRTEQEESFYRPDGAELRATEGYFTFCEKNDAMQTYRREKEPKAEQADTPRQDEKTGGMLRQGTVGEAPRKKRNISAASVLVTAALLAAVLFMNRYNSRVKTDGSGSEAETLQDNTSVQALAVEGQVIETIAAGERTSAGAAEEGADGDENTGGDGTAGDDGSTGGDGTAGDDGSAGGDGTAADDGSVEEEGNANGNGTESGDETAGGEGAADGPEEETGGVTGENAGGDENAESSESGTDSSGDGTAGAAGSREIETVQTGSRVSARYYTVKDGETLYSICMDVYRTSAMVEIVRSMNGIGEDCVIQAGQKILLP